MRDTTHLYVWHDSNESAATQRNTPQHTAAHCSTLQHTAAHCNTLQHTKTHCTMLQYTSTHCNTLQHTATHYDTRTRVTTDTNKHFQLLAAIHCNTLQHTATHCNSLQHIAKLCNTLQHTASHCNTLQYTTPHEPKSPQIQISISNCSLPYTATHYTTPKHTATHCNTPPNSAAHCSTLQHTAIHSNTRTRVTTDTNQHFQRLTAATLNPPLHVRLPWEYTYGGATMSRSLQIIGLFCKRALWKRLYSTKETYNLKTSTPRTSPLSIYIWGGSRFFFTSK